MKVLVTGGTGYIGSHTCVALLEAGHDVCIVDNLSNSSVKVLNDIADITGSNCEFVEGDVRDTELMVRILREHGTECVMHFAGLKSVSDSINCPIDYFDNNVNGTLSVLKAMDELGIKQFVFSSSATVYGTPATLPIDENCPTQVPTTPYGKSKLIVEYMLQDLVASDENWRIAQLRYFNPIGAHESGILSESLSNSPTNVMPRILLTALEKDTFTMFSGYDTPDGSGIRDYIHVVDLALGHLAAMEHITKNNGLLSVNLGTGQGTSVCELVHAFEKVTGKSIVVNKAERREGDVDECWADVKLAKDIIQWEATRDVHEMCKDVWNAICNKYNIQEKHEL